MTVLGPSLHPRSPKGTQKPRFPPPVRGFFLAIVYRSPRKLAFPQGGTLGDAAWSRHFTYSALSRSSWPAGYPSPFSSTLQPCSSYISRITGGVLLIGFGRLIEEAGEIRKNTRSALLAGSASKRGRLRPALQQPTLRLSGANAETRHVANLITTDTMVYMQTCGRRPEPI